MFTALLACLSLCLQDPTERTRGDSIELHSGERLDGRVLWADDRQVVVRVDGRVREYPRDLVRKLNTRTEALAILLKSPLAIGEGRAGQWSDYARFAQSRGLDGEARALAWASLLIDPEHAAGHEILGQRPGTPDWQRARELLHAAPDAQKPWRFSSLHHELKSELPLKSTLQLYWQLERMEHAWRGGIARELELRETTLPLFVEVYADRRRFPLPRERTERLAWVGVGPTLYIDAQSGLPQAEWTALALRERIEMSFARLEYPCMLPLAWSEGLARLAADADWNGPGTRAWPEPALPETVAARVAKSRTRRSIAELLRLDRNELDVQSGFVQRSEECQALVDWALQSEDENVRAATLVYFGWIARGKEGPIKELERAFGSERDRLDTLLLDWTRARAGMR